MSGMRDVPLPALVAIVAGESPFDAIRRTDADGEWWSARELMPLLGYQRWESFQDAIYRASISAKNSGTDGDHFRGFPNVIEGGRWGQQSVQDFRLTRYGAYLVAMNGDPRKPEIAAAQSYFAIKAREAEIAPARPALPQSFADALQLAADQARQIERQGQQIAELEPSAAAWNQIASGVKDWDVADSAKFLSNDPSISIGRDRLFERLLEMGWVYRGGDGRWRAKQSEVDLERLAEMPQTRQRHSTGERVRTAPQVRITPKGLRELHKRLGGSQPLQINEQLTLD